MSLFEAENKIPTEQMSVSLPSVNGLNYSATQEIRFEIPDNIEYFNPKATSFECDVKLAFPTLSASQTYTRLQLDPDIGAQSLISRVQISTKSGVLLEEIAGYDVKCKMEYNYTNSQSVQNKRAITEGCTTETPDSRGTLGGSKSNAMNHSNNPYFQSYSRNAATLNGSSAPNASEIFVDCKVVLPLHCGILGADRAFPNKLAGSLVISILLQDNNRVFRQLDSVMKYRRLKSNPLFHSINGSKVSGSLAPNGSTDTFYFQNFNSQHISPSHCPFLISEQFGFTDENGSVDQVFTAVDGTYGLPTISALTMETVGTETLMKVTLNASVKLVGGGMNASDGDDYYAYSRAITEGDEFNPTYTVSNCNLICEKVSAGGFTSDIENMMREGGSVVYDFMNCTNYRYSQLVGDRVAQISINPNSKRMKAICCLPCDASVYRTVQAINASATYRIKPVNNQDVLFYANDSGLAGISNNLSSYQFLYGSEASGGPRLQPSRRVSTSKTSSGLSISAQPLIETDKALDAARIYAHSFAKFNENFGVFRAVALENGVYDARGVDFQLSVEYNETNGPQKPMLWNNFVYSLRSIVIRQDSVTIDI
tara:strand:+ start:236 stop:2023 length:1788 start_codon:yes stop_codon:yes gene_type:complete